MFGSYVHFGATFRELYIIHSKSLVNFMTGFTAFFTGCCEQ